jgi:hypothetical protein
MASRGINEPQHAFRFLDVDQEPQAILPPIQDYENTPLVSLDKAVVPLQSILPDIKHMVQTIRAHYCEIEDGLTRDESNSIRLYSLEWCPRESSLFYILQKALRSKNRELLRPWFLFLRIILTALSHLPSTSLTVYRSANMDLTDRYFPGTTIIWWAFSSCMKKSNLLEKKLFLNKTGKRTLFVINCYSGKDIDQHSFYEGEGEVLLPPARQFNVVSFVKKGKGLHIIELNEIQPAFDFLNTLSPPTNILSVVPMHNIQFQPISTVSLSKKWLPAALPNPRLEERFAYIFKQHSAIDLRSMKITDSDMDIVVSEIIIKRQCSELNLSLNKITYNGISILALTLRTNKVRGIIFSLLFSS